MKNRLKRNLNIILMYALIAYIVIIPFQIWITGISISLLIGFFFGFLNEIITELRKLNGEKFDNTD